MASLILEGDSPLMGPKVLADALLKSFTLPASMPQDTGTENIASPGVINRAAGWRKVS